jgi:3'-5' exoribonuclease
MSTARTTLARLSELAPGQRADFFALLLDKARGVTREGKPYYACRFRDARRTVSFMAWGDESNPWFAKCEKEWQAGHFYKLRAIYTEHERYGPQIDLIQIRPVNEADRAQGFDEALFVETSRHDIPAMLGELRTLAQKHIADEPLRKLVLRLLEQQAAPLQRLPAIRDRSYPFVGGLLEHTLSVARTALELAERYALAWPELRPPLNVSLVAAGAILHDIGRVLEMGEETPAPAWTVPGRLIGYQILSRDLVREAAREVPDLNPELLQLLEHILLTRLNPAEGMGPRQALVPEALLVHYADNLDLEMEQFARCLLRDEATGAFTDRDPVLNRRLLKARGV